ncbi:MAG: hypothetical protein AB7G93_23140 [Bdellovibrionales bacterium]
MSLKKWSSTAVGKVVANSGYTTVLSGTINIKKGDTLRIHGHVGLSNENYKIGPVAANIRTLVNGVQVGSTSAENVEPCCGTHHLPLYTDAVFVGSSDGAAKMEIQISAFRSGANVDLKVDGEGEGTSPYRQLLVEHYRNFYTESSAIGASAYRLLSYDGQTSPLITSFGSAAFHRSTAYSLAMNVASGDIVKILGQATGQWRPTYKEGNLVTAEMQGQGIYVDTTSSAPISAWATENFTSIIPTTPLFTHAVHRPTVNGISRYLVGLHSVVDAGGNLIGDGGHIHALRFTPVATSRRGFHLKESRSAAPSNHDPAQLTANASQPTVIRSTSIQGETNDLAVITGYVSIYYPTASGITSGISCASQLHIKNAAGSTVSSSAVSYKYVTSSLESLALRSEMVASLPSDGSYRAEMHAWCYYSQSSPVISFGQTHLIVDRYSAE